MHLQWNHSRLALAIQAICDQACENQPCEHKIIANFFHLCSIITYELFYKHNKSSVTTVEFNGLSSEIYGNEIPHTELKILPKI